jgi:hypothetical protein
MIRKRGTGEVHRRPVSLRSVRSLEAERARQRLEIERTRQRLEAAKAYAQLQELNEFRQKVRQVESRFASLVSFRRLVSEFCDAKYFELERDLSRSAQVTRDLKKEFSRLKFSLEVTSIALKVSAFSESFKELVHELGEEFIRPRFSARKKVDNLLDSVDSIQRQYLSVQNLFTINILLIQPTVDILNSLINDRKIPLERRDVYREFKNAHLRTAREVSRAGHGFRAFYLMRNNLEGPLGPAFYLRLLSLYGNAPRHPPRLQEMLVRSIEALIAFGSRKVLVSNRKRESSWSYMKLLRQFYLRRLGKPCSARSPELNIFWRQLDVLAPFELNWARMSTISIEISYLVSTLANPSPGLWSNLDADARYRHIRKLSSLHLAFDYTRADISMEYARLREVNWLRLQSESRIHDLGGTAFTIQSGLFTPLRPLSQDPSRFRQWMFEINSFVKEAISLKGLHNRQKQRDWSSLDDASDGPEIHEEVGIGSPSDDTPGSNARTRFFVAKVRGQEESPSTQQAANQMKPVFFRTSAKRSARAGTLNALDEKKGVVWAGNLLDTTSSHDKGAPNLRNVAHDDQSQGRPCREQNSTSLKEDVLQQSKKSTRNTISDRKHEYRRENISAQRAVLQKQEGQEISRSAGWRSRKVKSNSERRRHLTRLGDKKVPRENIEARTRRRVEGEAPPKDSRPALVSKKELNSSARRAPRSAALRKFGRPFSPTFSRRYSTEATTRGSSSADRRSENNFGFVAEFSPECQPVSDYREEVCQPHCDMLNAEDLEAAGSSPDTATVAEGLTTPPPESEDKDSPPQFWSHNLRKGPGGKSIIVHYCKSLESTERVARHFLESDVLGFDIEWKAQTSSAGGIKNNLSLIQLANEERIALFHVALFRPGRTLDELVAPSLKKLLESSDITKVGVSIRADCTRVRRYLGIDVRGQLELSHLYKLVKYSQTDPQLINRRAVNLSHQVEEHLGLPMYKEDEVRCSDWSRTLDYHQVQCEFLDC